MFDVGFAELLFLAVIGMVVIGPERLPAVARTVGKAVGTARRLLTGLQNQLEQEIKIEELNRKIMEESKDQAQASDQTAENTIHQPAEPESGDVKDKPAETSDTTEEINERN